MTANGTLAAFDQSTASVKVAGRLNSISVDLGSVVRRGQVIAQLEPNDYKLRVQQSEAALGQARARLGLSPDGTDDKVSLEQTGTVRQAKAQLEEARLSRERAVRLVEQGIVAKADFDSADATYKVAQSRYQDALEEIRNRQALLAQPHPEMALSVPRVSRNRRTVAAPTHRQLGLQSDLREASALAAEWTGSGCSLPAAAV